MPKNLEIIDEFMEKDQENRNDLIDEINPLNKDLFACQTNGIIEKISPSNLNIFFIFLF